MRDSLSAQAPLNDGLGDGRETSGRRNLHITDDLEVTLILCQLSNPLVL